MIVNPKIEIGKILKMYYIFENSLFIYRTIGPPLEKTVHETYFSSLPSFRNSCISSNLDVTFANHRRERKEKKIFVEATFG